MREYNMTVFPGSYYPLSPTLSLRERELNQM